MENDTFKVQFLSRFHELMSTEFNYAKTQTYYQEIHDLLCKEIPNQAKRFDIPSSYGEWERVMKRVDRFLSNRSADIDRSLIQFATEKTNIERLYPNPAHQLINVEVSSEKASIIEISIFNNMGQTVHHSRQVVGSGLTEIQLPINFRSGIYYLKIGPSTKKLVVIN